MHELGLMAGVIDAAQQAAQEAGAIGVAKVSLSVGAMTEALEDALFFAFDVIKEGTLLQDAELEVTMIHPRSICLDCDKEFAHDRFHMACPLCEGFNTKLVAGREMRIDSIEVDLPD